MAASEKGSSRGKASSLQGGLSCAVIQTIRALAAKHRRTPWPPFPMGQKSKGTYRSASSFLLEQLMQRSQEAEDRHGEEESEESVESEIMNLEEDFDGILREEAVAEALSDLGWSGPGTEQVYLNLNLSNCELVDVSVLCDYIHLQKLNLSANKIEGMRQQLVCSKSEIAEVVTVEMDCAEKVSTPVERSNTTHFLSNSLMKRSNNEIEDISGIENCVCLTHLSLAANKITAINGLGTLPIKVLCLRHNNIETITGLEDLKALQKLDLSYNRISSLQGLENHDLLEMINLEDNKIEELSEIEYIENLPMLRVLNLLKNPIQEKSEYWLFVIFMLLRLTELDQQKIRVEEKVTAVNKYDPPPEVVAVRDHMTHIVNSMSQPQRIFDRACHTTRPPYFGEGDRVDYHFISQEVFDEMLSMGVRSLKYSYFEPRYILVVPMDKEKYEGYLRRKGLFSRAEIDFTVSRVDIYIKMNRKFPGYFDAVINADDLDIAYKKLSEIIREYLGLTEEVDKGLAPTAGGPSSKKTISGVPAHLVPSPRRLARLQADGQNPEALLEVQTHSKSPLPQSQESTEEGQPPKKDPSPSSHLNPPQEVSSSTLGNPQPAQDISPKGKVGGGQAAHLPPKIITEMDEPEDEPGPHELKAEGQSSTIASQEPPQHPNPPPQPSPQPDQDKKSGESKGAPRTLPEPAGPDPASLSPQRVQDEGTEPANPAPSSSPHNPPEDPAPSDVVKPTGGSQPPLKDGTPKAEVVRASTPYPEIPPPQDKSTNSKHTQVMEQPMALLPRSRLAPTRLPQPQNLAPLQSRRPTPKLLSPSREEALGTSSDQTPAPSPRSLPTQDDPGKLPLISPPQSKPPPNPSPNAAHSPQQAHAGKASEVKLPLISPPVQEQAQQHSPNPPQEEAAAPTVHFPHIAAPSVEPSLPQNTRPRPASKPAKGRETPKVGHGHASNKKIPGLQASPHSQETAKQKDTRKKNLRQRETAKGSPHLRKIPAGKSQTAQQWESHNKPTPRNVSHPLDSGSPLSHTKATSADPQNQEEKTRKAQNSGKKDLAQSIGTSPNPEMSEGLVQEKVLSENQSIQEAQLPQPAAKSGHGEQAQKKERSQKREVSGKSPEQGTAAPSQLRAKETQALKDSSELRQGYAQRHSIRTSKQQSKEKRTRKNGDAPQSRSPAAPQDQMSEEEPSSRTGRLRARGSQSIKV
ncbi:leucine-rich repeats and guanylate kinase domain containing [Cricetulus griseus]